MKILPFCSYSTTKNEIAPYIILQQNLESSVKALETPPRNICGVISIISPRSDQHQISPSYINALLNRAVMRITDMITQDEFT